MEIQVSPQHTGPSGTRTSNPASSSTWTAAMPTSGENASVNVSTHSTTGRRPGVPGGSAGRSRDANQRRNDAGANVGSSRRRSTPATAFATRDAPGARSAAFATAGIRDASRAHRGSHPSA